jgi:hypothetical protein
MIDDGGNPRVRRCGRLPGWQAGNRPALVSLHGLTFHQEKRMRSMRAACACSLQAERASPSEFPGAHA